MVDNYLLDIGPMGPIGEGESLILRATRHCPWNKCLFCPVYKDKKFALRSVPEIKKDIDKVRFIAELVNETSWRVGFSGRINGQVLQEVVYTHPEIYGKDDCLDLENYYARLSLSNVVNWLVHGMRRVFLQDANTLVIRPEELVEVLKYLKKTFPDVETVTSYARSKTCARRSLPELEKLKEAGLSWLFVGIESGCNEVLKFMQKGATAEEHIEGGQKVIQAGINLAVFVMPGLAGKNEKLAEKHVLETIRVLNEIKPTEVRIRSLAVLEGSPLYAKWAAREFAAPTEEQMIDEIQLLIENLHFDCLIETLQMTNVLFNIKGRLSARKEVMLAKIAQYKAMSPIERQRFRLDRYLHHGYLDFVHEWGKYDVHLHQLIEEARESLEKKALDNGLKTERAIFAIRSKGIP